MDHNNGELDRILDEGLATYSSGEPWPGLEDRVLTRVFVARAFLPVWFRAMQRWRIWRWAVLAIPAAVCLLLAVSVVWHRQEVRPPQQAGRTAQVQPEPMRQAQPPAPAPLARDHRRAPVKKSVRPALEAAKREQFPTPAPLSREERALISLAMSAPVETQAFFGEPAPIEIEPIQIEPLQIGGQSEEKFQ